MMSNYRPVEIAERECLFCGVSFTPLRSSMFCSRKHKNNYLYHRDREVRLGKVRQYRLENKEKCKESVKKSYLKNREKFRAYGKLRYVANRDRFLQERKKYRIENKELVREQKKKDFQLHKDRARTYINNRRKNDINFKLSIMFRVSLLDNLRKQSAKKEGRALVLLGCDIPFFKAYMEKQFVGKMSWDNHGKVWQIDHRIPCKMFDLSDAEQQKKCFHYTNMQPKYKFENLSKGGRYAEPSLVQIFNQEKRGVC